MECEPPGMKSLHGIYIEERKSIYGTPDELILAGWIITEMFT